MRPMGTFLALLISSIGRIGLISLISPILNAPTARYRFQYPWLRGGNIKGY